MTDTAPDAVEQPRGGFPEIKPTNITDLEGRKVFISTTMAAADGALLTEAAGLMVRLLPHPP